MANATVFAGLAILVLVFVATVLSVVFATRGAMASNAVVVSVLHICGAEDGFIAREFQRHFLLLGLRGGLFGAAVAALVFAVLGFVVVPAVGQAPIRARFPRCSATSPSVPSAISGRSASPS